jgi:Glutamate synthase central domain.
MVVKEMALKGTEPIYSMGNDTPISVLSRRPKMLASYFKQRFAQVTNPPIDPIREKAVMSLKTYVGKKKTFYLRHHSMQNRLFLIHQSFLTTKCKNLYKHIQKKSK